MQVHRREHRRMRQQSRRRRRRRWRRRWRRCVWKTRTPASDRSPTTTTTTTTLKPCASQIHVPRSGGDGNGDNDGDEKRAKHEKRAVMPANRTVARRPFDTRRRRCRRSSGMSVAVARLLSDRSERSRDSTKRAEHPTRRLLACAPLVADLAAAAAANWLYAAATLRLAAATVARALARRFSAHQISRAAAFTRAQPYGRLFFFCAHQRSLQ